MSGSECEARCAMSGCSDSQTDPLLGAQVGEDVVSHGLEDDLEKEEERERERNENICNVEVTSKTSIFIRKFQTFKALPIYLQTTN